MKYIIFQDGGSIIFSENVSHKSMANNKPVLSVGFCRIETYRNNNDDIRAHISCWGESTSLDVKSNPYDHEDLEKMFII